MRRDVCLLLRCKKADSSGAASPTEEGEESSTESERGKRRSGLDTDSGLLRPLLLPPSETSEQDEDTPPLPLAAAQVGGQGQGQVAIIHAL